LNCTQTGIASDNIYVGLRQNPSSRHQALWGFRLAQKKA